MSPIQLSFSLRVSSGAKAVHLLGSWDNYVGQLPLSRDKSSSRPGAWKGTFRFHSATLEAGKRYWYYYIVDGYHVAHNPSVASTTEPTTGRELNILDVPADKHSKSSKSSSKPSHKSSSSSHKSPSKPSSSHKSSGSSRHHASSRDHGSSRTHADPFSGDIPKGRPLSVSQIQAPKPIAPHAARHILEADYSDAEALEALTARFGSVSFDEYYPIGPVGSSSPLSTGSPLSYMSSGASSPGSLSSLSGYSTPSSDCSSCTCERYGITRKGERLKLDCGGSRCGYGDSSSCASGASDDEDKPVRYARASYRRNAIVVS